MSCRHDDDSTLEALNTERQEPSSTEPSQKPNRSWKTRQDPFRLVYDDIEQEINMNPNIHGKKLLQQLMEKYPGQFCHGHLRTLQRRILTIREQQQHRKQQYQQLMVAKKNMTKITKTSNINIS